jgi:hypothetical protein
MHLYLLGKGSSITVFALGQLMDRVLMVECCVCVFLGGGVGGVEDFLTVSSDIEG